VAFLLIVAAPLDLVEFFVTMAIFVTFLLQREFIQYGMHRAELGGH
jgi:hypothetical protein